MQVIVPEGSAAAKKPESDASAVAKPAEGVPELKKNKAEPVAGVQTDHAAKNSAEEKTVH